MKKTISFAVLHFTVAFTVAYLLTGELLTASLIALIEPAVNTVAFYFHDPAGTSSSPTTACRPRPAASPWCTSRWPLASPTC